MDKTDKVKRSFYLTQKTNEVLNKYVDYYHETITGTTYGGASTTADEAITTYCTTALNRLEEQRRRKQ